MGYKRTFYDKYIKRLIDFILSVLAIIILSPILVIVAVLVRVKLGSPVIFKQQRPGLNETIFTMYKFRTMTNETDDDGNLLPDEVRLTKFGKMLRSTSLDELPELFNILKGDMAIVGPRPQLVRDMVFMTSLQRQRHFVRPGLTGYAQISGRNEIDWEEKLQYDINYLSRLNFKQDVIICFKTLRCIFRREGITGEGLETAEDLGDYLLRKNLIDRQQYELRQMDAMTILKGNSKK